MISTILKSQVVLGITKICGQCSIYLFGSYAYGTPSLSSDLDIAVIIDTVESNSAKAVEIWKELQDIPMPKDIVVASQKEFDFYKNEPGSLFRTIAQKGILLNG
jgi:predicted nucleotidyltransferase